MSAAAQLNSALSGRYAIEREIGRGGMATVYLAHDVRHERRVALKVLDPELGAVLGIERFLAEIRVTASLQHPNLLPLFDSGEASGLLYYVMPFIDGESLRGRLWREKQLPIDEAVRIATGVASALDYAHRHGVIHRDLKPENILLQDGQPLVADFGIALAVSRAGGTRVTQTGISLGTPQYMSPEQATGDRQIDGRSDVYSLGAVLYEMLSGEPPFSGTTAQALIAKLLTDEPRAVRLTRPAIPPRLEAVTHRALQKLPADRFQTAQELALALQGEPVALPDDIITPGSLRSASAPAGLRQRLRDPVTLSLAALLLVAAGVIAVQASRPRGDGEAVTRTSLALPAVMPVTSAGGKAIAISPDGRMVIYSGLFVEGGQNIFVRRLDDLQPRALPGMQLTLDPSISPDGRWIAFASGAQIHKVNIAGGPALFIGEGQTLGTTWVGNELVACVKDSRIWLYPASGGGDGRPLTAPDPTGQERLQSYPVASNDGRFVFYNLFEAGGSGTVRLGVGDVKTGRSAALNVSAVGAIGMVDDALVYARADGAVMAVRFDAANLRVAGEPVPLGEQVTAIAGAGVRAALSASGTLVYQLGAPVAQLVVLDSTGAERERLGEPKTYVHPRFSPDGRRVAVSFDGEVWVIDLASQTPMRLTTFGRNDRPEWTPDGVRVMYRTTRDGADQLWWQPADGSGAPERLHRGAQEGVPSPDGRWLLYRRIGSTTKRDIHYRALSGDTTSRVFVATEFEELTPRFSRDGRWVAYVSDESGTQEVYVRAFPGPSGKVQISLGGGTEPVWAPNGRDIIYRKGRTIMAARVALAPAFAVVGRRALFEGTFASSPIHANFDVSPDGRRFLMVQPNNVGAQVIVVQNWAREVRARLRAAR